MTADKGQTERRFSRPYFLFCAAALCVWVILWLLAAHNLYGWLIDDQDTFARYQQYTTGGANLVDIPWFHAYMWFLMLPPWQLHWSVPSHIAPRAWEQEAQFRALIMYTVGLHVVVLAFLAYFLRHICANRFVAAAAFLLVLTSPTLMLYTPLLDSRYLGLIAALPAMILLLHAHTSNFLKRNHMAACFLSGILFGVAEDIHYECLYLVVPFAILYWALALWRGASSPETWRAFAYFVAGLLCWILPVQGLSLLFHPFGSSYVGTLLTQYTRQIPPYSRAEGLSTWLSLYVSEMGVPLMIAVVAGGVMLANPKWRPPYISDFNAYLMTGCAVCFAIYVFESPTYPFYRMSFGLQFFYAIFAASLVERIASKACRRSRVVRYVGASLVLLLLAYVPSVLRTPEVYAAQQGYGEAINLAYKRAGVNHVKFIDVFDKDDRSEAVISRSQFESMSPNDYLVTYFPESFNFKYPDLFALLYNTTPVASYPTLWCTKEMWSQVPTFFGTRRWSDEPPNCEARVFRVRDIRAAARGPRLNIQSIEADSVLQPRFNADRVFALRQPSLYWSGSELWHPYWDLWVSASLQGEHYLDVDFSRDCSISKITVVPAEFRIPPDFLWHGRKRVENMRIYGAAAGGRMRPLWAGQELQDKAIFSATFTAVTVSHLRFVMWQSAGPNPAVGIKYIYFPGYEQRTAWSSIDPPGLPPPGH